jgi:hypothetical protein
MTPVDLRAEFRPEDGQTFYKPERTGAIVAAMDTPPFRNFLAFVQYPIWVSEPVADQPHATRVRLVDLRFGTPPEPGFEAIATVMDGNRVADSVFTLGGPRSR